MNVKLEFGVNKFIYTDLLDNIDVSFVSPILRRRLSKLDKCTIYLLNNTFSDDIQNIVFSSKYGEIDRLIKLIEQYTKDNEVSPNLFAGSVHNYPVGFFLMLKQKTIPYTSLSACNNSISNGLLTALVSKYDKTLYCYCDCIDDKILAFALKIDKNNINYSDKYCLTLLNNNKEDDFTEYIDLFEGRINGLTSSLFKLERAADIKC